MAKVTVSMRPTRTSKMVLLVLGLAAVAVQIPHPAGAQPPLTPEAASLALLDGRSFEARIVGDGGEVDPLEDRLTFENGMFSSAICRTYNFAEAPYWVRVEDGRIHFLAELTSPTDGVMLWKGSVQGDELHATMRWIKERWYWTIDAKHKISGKLASAEGRVGISPE